MSRLIIEIMGAVIVAGVSLVYGFKKGYEKRIEDAKKNIK